VLHTRLGLRGEGGFSLTWYPESVPPVFMAMLRWKMQLLMMVLDRKVSNTPPTFRAEF
jgi:hypothetical protein